MTTMTLDVAPRFLVLLVLLGGTASACGSTDETATGFDCATADVRPYSELADVMGYCTPCHKGKSAPRGILFDSYADAASDAAQGAAEIAAGRMPQGGGMPDDAKALFIAWAKCGTPE